jgi:hypothetical protein
MRGEDPWATPDPLGAALHVLRMSGTFYVRSELSAPWGLTLPPEPHSLWFHVVNVGGGWLEVEGTEPRLLRPGDFALVPHGEGHRIRSHPEAPSPRVEALPHDYASDRYAVLRHGEERRRASSAARCGSGIPRPAPGRAAAADDRRRDVERPDARARDRVDACHPAPHRRRGERAATRG